MYSSSRGLPMPKEAISVGTPSAMALSAYLSSYCPLHLEGCLMAMPTPQRNSSQSSPPTSRLIPGLRKFGATLARPLFAVILAMVAGVIVIMFTSPGPFGDRFSAAITAYQSLYMGSFGSIQSLSYTLVKVGPLILTGLSVAIAFRAGLFNIGSEGQLAVGAM